MNAGTINSSRDNWRSWQSRWAANSRQGN